MDHCEAHKAFDSLWSITDEIFKYVADIRTILNGSGGPEAEILSSDPPPYEDCMSEQLTERIKQKVTCLENLNEKRIGILGEFSIATKGVDLDENRQMREEPSENVADILRNNALKGLVSYSRTCQAALTTNLDLLEQTCKKLTRFCDELREPNREKNAKPNFGCSFESKVDFSQAMYFSEDFISHLARDREVLLREGKLVEETILKVPHETRRETTEIVKRVRATHRHIETEYLSTFRFLILPILEDYVEARKRSAMRDTINSVIARMRVVFNGYIQNVQAFNEALQSLADHLHI